MESASSATTATTTPPPNNNKPISASRRRHNHSKRRGKPRGPPPAPLLKLVLRNFASLDEMTTLIPPLFASAGAIPDGQQQLNDHVAAERAVAAASEEWKKQQLMQHEKEDASEQEDEDMIEENGGNGVAELKEESKAPTKMTNGSVQSKQSGTETNYESTSKVPAGALVVRIMYIVAPRNSRRRGAVPGSVYVVLTVTGITDTADERTTAQTRLRLHTAFDQMQSAAASSTISVHEARSAKAWKEPRRFGNETGTIFQTAEYKEWLESTTAASTELSARPKPVPGGTPHTSTTTSAVAGSGPPVAALVTYLQNKRSSERQRHAVKQQASRSTSNNTNNAAVTSKKKESRNRRPRRKKRKPTSTTATPGP